MPGDREGTSAPIIGVDPSKNDLVLVVLSESGEPIADDFDVLRPGAHGSEAQALADSRDRITQHLRRLRPRIVGIFGTTKYASWKLADLRPRSHLEAALLIAAAENGIPVAVASPPAIAKALAVPQKDLVAAVTERLDLTGYTKMDRRARAAAAGLYVAEIKLPPE